MNEVHDNDTKPYHMRRADEIRKDKLVYISGPLFNGDIVVNTRQAILTATVLFKEGYTPIIPHLVTFWHFLTPEFERREWLNYCRSLIRRVDILLRISGESLDADREVDYAISLGIPVVYSVIDLIRPVK
jgi:hypothetical protein